MSTLPACQMRSKSPLMASLVTRALLHVRTPVVLRMFLLVSQHSHGAPFETMKMGTCVVHCHALHIRSVTKQMVVSVVSQMAMASVCIPHPRCAPRRSL
jgi:hypothetical protein